MNSKSFKLIASGSNSQVYMYSAKKATYALKVVPIACTKEVYHLANEVKVLSALDHDFVIKPIKYQENYDFHGKK